MPDPTAPDVLIVMCTYNGARHLQAQLDSFANQDIENWALVVSDDGSSDDTCDIIRAFARDHRVILHTAPDRQDDLMPAQRAANNYMRTLMRSDLPLGPDTYVALADQDDVWRPDKMSHAVTALDGADHPVALYGGQSRHVREDGEPITHSRAPARASGLHNALVQNVVSGHAAVLTPQAMTALRKTGLPQGIWYHDWWIYLLISALGGSVIVDNHIGLDYRQHDANVMGAGRGIPARARRLGQIFNGEYGTWVRANLVALAACDSPLTPQARDACAVLDNGITATALWRSGAYRHSTLETLCIYIAGSLHKL